MNEELQKQVISLVEKAKEVGEDTATFIAKQAPDVASQIIAVDLINGLVSLAIGITIVTAVTLGIKKTVKASCRIKDEGDDEGAILLAVVVGVISLLMSIGALFEIDSGARKVLKAHFAPKVVIMEKLSSLVK